MNPDKKIVMLCTSGTGGIRSVTEGFQRDGVFDCWNVDLVHTARHGSLPKKLMEFVKAFFRVFKLIVQGRVALLHCHVSMGNSFWRKSIFAILCRRFGIPVILHLHAGRTKAFYDLLSSFSNCLGSQQLTAATTVLVLSETWRSFVLEVAPKANVVVLPNYVEVPKHIKASRKGSQINVLFLGLIGENKGVYNLLPAFAEAVKNVPQLFLRIGGDGEVDKARALAHELGLESHVEFLGWVGGNEKNELLRDADIFVLPSYNEGLPVSLLEAMSWGIPVISTTVGGIPDLVEDHVNGYLISPGDRLALQSLLEQLACDPAIRDRIGSAARESIQRQYSKEMVLPKLTALYEEHANVCKQDLVFLENHE